MCSPRLVTPNVRSREAIDVSLCLSEFGIAFQTSLLKFKKSLSLSDEQIIARSWDDESKILRAKTCLKRAFQILAHRRTDAILFFSTRLKL
jgi:hypothetical protein